MSFFCCWVFFSWSQSSPSLIYGYVCNALAPTALCGWTRPHWNTARPGVMPPLQSCFLSLFPHPPLFYTEKLALSQKKNWVRKTQDMRVFLFFSGASLPADVGRETPENLFGHSHAPALCVRRRQLHGTCPSPAHLISCMFAD